MKTSVVFQNFKQDEQCSNSLNEFLTPTFTNVLNSQQKKIGNKLKTHAQVLGMKVLDSNENTKETTVHEVSNAQKKKN